MPQAAATAEKPRKEVPTSAVTRLVKYLYALQDLEAQGRERVMAAELGELANEPVTHVRKDLNYFGRFGVPGHGYHVRILLTNLERILGATSTWEVVVLGTGALAQAILEEERLTGKHIDVKGVVSVGGAGVGEELLGHRVRPLNELASLVQTDHVKFGILACAQDEAQEGADALVMTGIAGILNFTGVVLKAPRHIHVENVSLLSGVHRLVFYHKHRDLRPMP